MNKFVDFLDKYLGPVADVLSNNRFLKSIANGIVVTMPLTMIAAIFSIIEAIPDIATFLPDWSEAVSAALLYPYNVLFGILALIISFTVAYRHSEYYKVNPINGGLISLICFIIIAAPYGEGTFTATYLGYAGIFTAVIIALTSVELYRFTIQKKITIRMPDSVPPMVSDSFAAIIPLMLIVSIYYIFSLVCQSLTGDLFPALVQSIVTPALEGSDSIAYQAGLHFFMQLFFWLGMHGWAILGGILIPIQTSLLAGNAEAAAAGQALPYVTGGGFNMVGTLHWFIPLLFIFLCKAKRNKAIGKATLVPAIFGISEPFTFGTPIVLNPILGIPFILYQPICMVINVAAIQMGFLNRSSIAAPNGVPTPFGTWIATGGDWRTFIVFLVILAVAVAIWLPFVIVWDRKCLREEAEIEMEKEAS